MTSRRPRSTPLSLQPSLWEGAAAWSLPLLDLAGEEAAQGSDEPEDAEPATSRRAQHRATTSDSAANGSPPPTPRPRTPSFVCEVPLRVTASEERVLLTRLQAAWQQAHPTTQPASAGATTRPRRSGSVRRRKAVRAAELVARDRHASQPKGPVV